MHISYISITLKQQQRIFFYSQSTDKDNRFLLF